MLRMLAGVLVDWTLCPPGHFGISGPAYPRGSIITLLLYLNETNELSQLRSVPSRQVKSVTHESNFDPN